MTGGVLSMISTIVNADYTDYTEETRCVILSEAKDPLLRVLSKSRSCSRSAGAALPQDDKWVPQLDRVISAIRVIRAPFSWNFHFDATFRGAKLSAEEMPA